MDLEQARDWLRSRHRAVLATVRADGTPQLSPVTCGLDDVGRVVVSTRETAVKTRNLRRDPRGWLCVLTDEFYGGHVQIEGRATVISLPDAMEPLVAYYRAVAGEHPAWDDYRAAMERDQRVLLRFELLRAGPDISG